MQKHVQHVSPRNVPTDWDIVWKFTGVDSKMTVGCQIECKWIVKNGAKVVMNREFFDRRWPTTLTQRAAKLSISIRLDCYLHVTDWQEETEADHGPNGLLMKIRGGWKVNTVTKWCAWSRSITEWRRSGHVMTLLQKSFGICLEFCISEANCELVL